MSFSGWREVKLEEILFIPIRNGLSKPKAIRGAGVKMVNMGEIFKYDRIFDIEMDRVPTTDKEFANSKLEKGDLLFARQSLVWDGAGKCSVIMEANEDLVFESHIIRVRLNKKQVTPFFYYYYFKSHYGKENIRSIVEQVAAAGIRGSDLIKLRVPIPPFVEQEKISMILSCLDDKIELNYRINKTLEEMAQAIFKSWFVDFEPFQEGEFEDSELGRIPKGWRVGSLGGIANITSGKRPLRKQGVFSEEICIPVVGASSIMAYTTEVLYNERILITGRVGTHGIIQRFNSPCWASDNTLVIKSAKYEFVYQVLKNVDFKSMNRGSTQPLITQTDLKNVTIIIPSNIVLENFETTISKLMNIWQENNNQNKTLTTIRDSLLPKLMCGEIRVPIEEVQ